MNSNFEVSIRPVIISKFGPPTLACIRSWGRQGLRVGMVCIRSKREANPHSKYLTEFTSILPEELYTKRGIEVIKQFLKRFRPSGILCIDERIACWLNDNYKEFPSSVKIWLPSNSTIKDLLSKEKQIEIAHRVGLNVLPTYFINEKQKISHQILPKHFPLCLRPSVPETVKPTFKALLAYSPEALEKILQSLRIEKPIIAQPFMSLPNMVVHGVRTLSGTTIGLRAFWVERKFEGVTLTISPTTLNKELKEKCIAFTDYFKLTGSYHFEFLINKMTDTTYFLEINSRFGGTTAKVYACGYDEPLLALQAYGLKVKNPKKIKNTIVSNKGALVKYLLYTIKGILTPLDYPSEPKAIRIINTLYGLIKYKDDIFMLDDIKGGLALYLGNIRNRVNIQIPAALKISGNNITEKFFNLAL